MQKETKKHVKCYRAFTLVEVILVVGTIAIVAGTLVGLISNGYEDWKLGNDRSILLQDGRAVLEQMTRILRQAKSFSSVSLSTDSAGYITFADINDIINEFRLNTQTNEIEYGQPGSLSTLAGSVSSLVFTCFDANADNLADPVQVRKIRAVNITVTLANAAGSLSFTLSDRVLIQGDLSAGIVINEIMYNPSDDDSDASKEWVELYNASDSAIDVNGWTIWTGNQSNSDALISHRQFGNGTTTIPANGYAVVTAEATDVYTELGANGNFETNNISSWITNPGSSWTRTSGNAHGGSYKLESTAAGAASVYQQITIPTGFNSCLFLFWERATAPVAQTQITTTIRNLSDQILATDYSGQMNSNWTCHTMDITAFAGQTIRIYFSTNKATGSGSLMLDDISAASSYVNINAVRLSVDDNKIGSGIVNDGDVLAVVGGGSLTDRVSFLNSWGGNGNGTSLSRIDPQGSSNQQSNWKSGPQHGTPGSAN